MKLASPPKTPAKIKRHKRWAVAATGFVSDYSTHTDNNIFGSLSFIKYFDLPFALRTAMFERESGAGGILEDVGVGSAVAAHSDCQARSLLNLLVSEGERAALAGGKERGAVERVCGSSPPPAHPTPPHPTPHTHTTRTQQKK